MLGSNVFAPLLLHSETRKENVFRLFLNKIKFKAMNSLSILSNGATPNQKLNIALFISLVLVLSLSSCVSSKKIDNWVSDRYEGTVSTVASNNNISISTSDSIESRKVSRTETKSSKTIPLVFFWKWERTHTCSINENIPLNQFTKTVNFYANAYPLKSRIAGRRLELLVNGLPHTFTLEESGWKVAPFLSFAGSKEFYISPNKEKMVVEYRLLEGDVVKKTGTITIPSFDKLYEQFEFRGDKDMTQEYLDQYDRNMVKMSKFFVDKLAVELTPVALNATAAK